MNVLERDISKKWIHDHLRDHPADYAYRIIDTPWGGAKPFDWFLFCEGIAWALEFKVERRKTFKYSISELPAHQYSELLKFMNGKERKSQVVIYHESTEEWHTLEIHKT